MEANEKEDKQKRHGGGGWRGGGGFRGAPQSGGCVLAHGERVPEQHLFGYFGKRVLVLS